MRRRIWLLGAAITAGALALSVGTASATKSKHHKTPKPKPIVISAKCTLKVAGVAPADQTTFTPGSESGDQFGAIACPGTAGRGLAEMTFAVDDSGDLTGDINTAYSTGTVKATYTLTSTDASTLDVTTFASADYTGTLDVTGGTGTFSGVTGNGTLTCHTPDSVHLTCAVTVKLTEPPVATSTGSSSSSKSTKG